VSKVTWTLTDSDEGIDLSDWSIGPSDVDGMPGTWSVAKRTLVGGKRDGVSVVEVDNGEVRFTVVPTRGMGLWRAWHGERMLGWQSPVKGPVHPRFVPVSEPSGLGWLEGMDELLVRCGLTSNGAPEFDEQHNVRYPLHGRIANLPAHRLTVTVDGKAQTISVTGEVDETRLLFHHLRLTSTITTRLGETVLDVDDVVQNCAGTPAEFQMLYHINVGSPVLQGQSQLVAPSKTVIPRTKEAGKHAGQWNTYGSPQAGFAEQVYFHDLLGDEDGRTRVLLKNPAGTEGVSLVFNLQQLPCFIQWKHTGALEDGYVTGLEPATNLPNPRSFEARQGRVVPLKPGASYPMHISLQWLHTADDVQNIENAVRSLQGGIETHVFNKPQREWCADA